MTDHVAYASSIKNQNRLNRDGTFFFFSPGVGAPRVYVRAWAPVSYTHLTLPTMAVV